MGCPVHIWVPLMAAAAPVVRVAKDRIVSLRYRGAADDLDAATAEAAPAPRRWAPIDPHATD
jgi:hypothetical protein